MALVTKLNPKTGCYETFDEDDNQNENNSLQKTESDIKLNVRKSVANKR